MEMGHESLHGEKGGESKETKNKDEVGSARAMYSLKRSLERDTIRLGRSVYSVFMVECIYGTLM